MPRLDKFSPGLIALAFVASHIFFAQTSAAQSSAPQAQEPPASVIRSEVTLVTLDVSILDKQGRFVPDLKAENFLIKEDGAPQALRTFVEETGPIRIALLVEASPAVFLIRQDHIVAAIALLRSLRPADEVALLTFSDQLRVVHGFTRNKDAVMQVLLSIDDYGHGTAAIFTRDALGRTLDWLGKDADRTAVLLIGTGLDLGSATGAVVLIERWKEALPSFYAMATGMLLRDPKVPFKPFDEADAFLRDATSAGRGEVWFPESADDLPGIYRRLGERLRNLYTLTYKPPPGPRDGSFRGITIELLNMKGKATRYRVLARDGYFMTKP